MMVELARLIHQNTPYRQRNFGAALEQMFVSFAVIGATGAGKAMNPSEIASLLSMPRTNVVRHMKALADAGRVRVVGSSYLANLDGLDDFLTPDRIERLRRVVTATARKVARASRSSDDDE